MSWKQDLPDRLSKGLRWFAWGCVIVDAILIGAFSVWFTWESVWKLGRVCKESLFS